MQIKILDGCVEDPEKLNWSPLAELGELSVCDRVPMEDAEKIAQTIGDAEIIVINKVLIGREVLDACPNLRYIAVASTGYNQVDVDYTREKNILVSNVPGYGTDAVAQFTIALLLELCGRVSFYNRMVHDGEWGKDLEHRFWECPLTELSGKTMGIIGFGSIGRQVGRIAKAMGMKVVAYNRSECEEGREIGTYVDLDTLLRTADVISLHCPLFPETEKMINQDAVAKMKPGVMLLNTSRGGVLDEQAVADALRSGHIAAAGIDVVSKEPIEAENPLLDAPNCVITPHVAWAAKECRQRIVDCVIENVRTYIAGAPTNIVNR